MNIRNKFNNDGYAALASILVISVVVIIVGISVSLLSINYLQSSLSNKKSYESLDLVEACVEEALLQLNENNAISSNISLPEGSCSVTINSQVGTNWVFTVTGSINSYIKSIQVTADRNNTINILNWLEV